MMSLDFLSTWRALDSPELVDVASTALKKRYGDNAKFAERLRLAGYRTKDNLQGLISRYDIIAHLDKGNVVYHLGGWVLVRSSKSPMSENIWSSNSKMSPVEKISPLPMHSKH